MIDLAVQLVDKKSGSFEPKKFEDHYGTALKDLVQEKTKGHKVVAKEAEHPSDGNVSPQRGAHHAGLGDARRTEFRSIASSHPPRPPMVPSRNP
jgi:non-homologous end joining protein Ku